MKHINNRTAMLSMGESIVDLKILDCTLRDGGYYNDWDFDLYVVQSYLDSLALANIDYVELGLRSFPRPGFLGGFAYTTEDFLSTLLLPENLQYGVMVDAKTILSSDFSVCDAVSALFVPAKDSPLSLVRVAAHFHEVSASKDIVKQLHALGYVVGFNLMQANGKTSEVIREKAEEISQWGVVEVLYFADSLGNMDADDVMRIITDLRAHWHGPLGIHTHDNMGKGLDNTICAMDNGVTWADATVTGMGRGAGNTKLETLLAHMVQKTDRYHAKPIYELVIRTFEPMQKNYGWGTNLLYFLGAQNNVHPTYIQNLLSNTHYGKDEIIGAIDYLSNLDGTTFYNGKVLDTALNFNKQDNNCSGTTKLQGLFDDKNLLLVANSESLRKYHLAIRSYIKRYDPTVIVLNAAADIDVNLVDYYVISHNSKFLSEAKLYKALSHPVILPKARFTKDELETFGDVELIDYGITIAPNALDNHGTYATVPYDLTIAYILAGLLESKPRSLSVVGFDGYGLNDPRQQEMISLLKLFEAKADDLKIIALTPTTYPVSESSIYAPF